MTDRASTRASRGVVALVALVGMLLPLLVAVRLIGEAGGDVSVFAAFGEDATETTDYARERLGDVHLREDKGHDGRFYFVQANDPWVLDPVANASVLDQPLYRSQRMLYPMLAGGFGLFGPSVIVWAMLVVNLVAMGVGTWVVALIAKDMGGSPWWGLAFALNIGFVSEVNIGGAGVVAGAAAFGAVLMVMRNRAAAGIGLLVVAALAREVMLLAAAGVSLWWWVRGRRSVALKTVAVPTIAVVAWAAYLRFQIGDGTITAGAIDWPFVGLARAFVNWIDDPIDLLVGTAIVLLLVVFTFRALSSRHVVGWAFLGFAALGLFLSEQVWRSYFDITRAVAPVITAFVLLAFAGSRQQRPLFADSKAE